VAAQMAASQEGLSSMELVIQIAQKQMFQQSWIGS
jgi:hypothetical protein